MRWLTIFFCFLLIAGNVFCQSLIPFKSGIGANAKWGYKNGSGQIVIPLQFEDARGFSEDLAAVKSNGLWGFINTRGQYTIRPQYFAVMDFSEGKAVVFDGKYGYINKLGVLAIPHWYNGALSFQNGVARVLQNNQWTFINHQGQSVSAPAASSSGSPAQRRPAPVTAGTGFTFLFALDRTQSGIKTHPAIDSIRRNGVMESLVTSLNGTLRIPYKVNIIFKRLNMVNAYYSPAEKTIYFGTELIEELYKNFSTTYRNQELTDATTGAVVFILFHEIGHALIDILDIPVAGREEEAADNFATFLFSTGSPALEKIAINGAHAFFNWSKSGRTITNSRLLDEHLLDGQRALSILCMLYGKDPARYRNLITSGVLPADERRQLMCKQEYSKLVTSWQRLLRDYLK